jgi:energy-coupling factor transporter ATP-binding protein EcfA2
MSGGERQRLAIARLLLKAPSGVVLDEATAHLDSESEAAVQRALEVALEGRTSLVIAHRLSTVRHADMIVVLDQAGWCSGAAHEQLVDQPGLYAELYPHAVRHGRVTPTFSTLSVSRHQPARAAVWHSAPGHPAWFSRGPIPAGSLRSRRWPGRWRSRPHP